MTRWPQQLKPGDTPIDLVPLLKDFAHRYRQDFERIGIRYSLEGLESTVVKAEDIHLDSIFSNLISNARDALADSEREEKEIRVKVEEKEGEVVIKVQDNGPGIPEQHLNEIFEPFFTTKPTTGTGLGLGIVKRLVQLYGGSVDVRTEEGKGTTFSISLPIQSESSENVTHTKAQSHGEMTENEIRKIVVDRAVRLHKDPGPGLLETVYEVVLAHQLRQRSLNVDRQVSIPIEFQGIQFDEGFRADIIVENKVILELKSVETINKAHK